MPHQKPKDLGRLVPGLERYWQTAWTEMDMADTLYYGKFEVDLDLPQKIQTHKSATPTLMIDEIREQIRVDEPVVTAKARKNTKTALKIKGLQEMWAQTILRQVAQDSMVDPIAQLPFDLPLRGASCLKWIPSPWVTNQVQPKPQNGESSAVFKERLENWQFARDNEPKFIARALDPYTVMPEPGTIKPTYGLGRQNRTVSQMEHGDYDGIKFLDPKRHDNPKTAEDPMRAVEWLEWWSWKYDPTEQDWYGWYIVEADGQRIIDKPNPVMHVPYSFRFSGLGRRDRDGTSARLAVNALQAVIGEIHQEIVIKTAMSAQWLFHAFPRLLSQGGNARQLARAFQKGPGAVITYTTDNPPTWMESPPPNADMLNFLDRIENNIQRRARPAFSGESQGNFGVQEALLVGQALKTVAPIKEQMNLMVSEMLEGIAKMMYIYNVTMNVQGSGVDGGPERNIKGDDLRRAQFEVSFEAIDPAENDRRMLALLAVRREGDLSRRTLHEKGLKNVITNPEEEDDRIGAERVVDALIKPASYN